MTVVETLRAMGARRPALDRAKAQPDQSPEALWADCRRGDWLLEALETHGVDCADLGYICAERARQSTLLALPPSPQRDALAACAPITDRGTALAAEAALAATWATEDALSAVLGVVGAAEWAAWAAAALWAAWAALGAADAAPDKAAELAAIADIVRASIPTVPEMLP